jgi:hypothetical protein
MGCTLLTHVMVTMMMMKMISMMMMMMMMMILSRCVPGTRTAFTCPLMEVVLEFVEYHVQMGVDHVMMMTMMMMMMTMMTMMMALFRCVPGTRTAFTCPLMEVVLEFVEYHVQMGVDHIHLGVDYPFGSPDMDRLLEVTAAVIIIIIIIIIIIVFLFITIIIIPIPSSPTATARPLGAGAAAIHRRGPCVRVIHGRLPGGT